MGVSLFKSQFRISADRLEVAAVPLSAMQIWWIGLSTTDAWLITVAITNEVIECLLCLRL
jgi:hypothetical protein